MRQPEEFDVCARRLKALADPARLRILDCLFAGAKNVGDLAAALNDEIVKVSHHLGVLRNAGLVESRKSGRHVEYTLHPDVNSEINSEGVIKMLDLGCCRLDLDEPKTAPRRGNRQP
jgi:DNA-binding transcriptional ArsR family regulator